MDALRQLNVGTRVYVYKNGEKISGRLRRIDDETECSYIDQDSKPISVVEICDDNGHVQQYFQSEIDAQVIRIDTISPKSPFMDPAIVNMAQKPEQPPTDDNTMPSPPTKEAHMIIPQVVPRFYSQDHSQRKIKTVVEVDFNNLETFVNSDRASSQRSSVAITDSEKTFKPNEKTASENITKPVVPATLKAYNVPTALIPPAARARAANKNVTSNPKTGSAAALSVKEQIMSRKQSSSTKTTGSNKTPEVKHTVLDDPAIVFKQSAAEPVNHQTTPSGQIADNKQPRSNNQRSKAEQLIEHKIAQKTKEQPKPKDIPAKTNSTSNSSNEAVPESIFKVTVDGKSFPCSTVSRNTMESIVEKCAKSCCSWTMMAENAGRCASIIALKSLANSGQSSPSIVVLIGNNRTGSYGIAAARHLANRGCKVSVIFAFDESAIREDCLEQKLYAESVGVIMLAELEDIRSGINSANMIIDASMLREFQTDMRQGNNREIMDCCLNSDNAKFMSFDLPSGVLESGLRSHPRYHFSPHVTVCFGAPIEGVQSVKSELYLAEIGIPPICWQEGVSGWTNISWGDQIVLKLEK